jgi:hypothetical protein
VFSAINKQENGNHENFPKACDDHKHAEMLKEVLSQGVDMLSLNFSIFLKNKYIKIILFYFKKSFCVHPLARLNINFSRFSANHRSAAESAVKAEAYKR